MKKDDVVLGTKRTCPGCHARFYDLMRPALVCPKCGMSFVAETILPSRGEHSSGALPPLHPLEAVHDLGLDDHDPDLVGLDDVSDSEEDSESDVPDVDLEDDATLLEEDDSFLEEGKGSVSGIIGHVKSSRPDDV